MRMSARLAKKRKSNFIILGLAMKLMRVNIIARTIGIDVMKDKFPFVIAENGEEIEVGIFKSTIEIDSKVAERDLARGCFHRLRIYDPNDLLSL